MTVEFEERTIISAPVEAVFDLSLDIDAHLASMSKTGERVVGGVSGGLIGLGETVTWRARHFGISFTMTSRITDYDRPTRFVDEQVKGPFRRFRHEHLFEVFGDQTAMIDRVAFDAPLGLLGRGAEALLLGKYLLKLIRERNAYLKQEAERRGGEGTPSESQ